MPNFICDPREVCCRHAKESAARCQADGDRIVDDPTPMHSWSAIFTVIRRRLLANSKSNLWTFRASLDHENRPPCRGDIVDVAHRLHSTDWRSRHEPLDGEAHVLGGGVGEKNGGPERDSDIRRRRSC
jgi:hypothetical protein